MRKIALIGAVHASFLANCGIGGIRVALEMDTGAGVAAGTSSGPGAVEMKAAFDNLKETGEKVRKLAEQAQTELKSSTDLKAETKATVDKALSDLAKQMKDYDARLADTEQKAARRGGSGGEGLELKTLGQHFADSEGFKKVKEEGSEFRGNVRHSVETKALMTATTPGTTTSQSNSLIAADRRGIVNLPDRTLKVRDLIMPGSTSSNSIEYPVEKLFDNQAAPVPEGTRKPESNIQFDMTSTTVKTLAHIFKGSRQLLDDAPGLISYIDGRARYGLRFIEEAQILYGNGQGQNLKGVMPQASAYSAPSGVTVAMETPIDRLRLAILQATLALYPATGIVLNDTDWARIELIKDTQGRHLIGNPQGQIQPTLWGLPVSTTLAMNVNEFLVGAFAIAAQLFDRMAIEVLISTENEDDFVKNMITIRAEERLALAVYRPQAFVKGNLVTPAA